MEIQGICVDNGHAAPAYCQCWPVRVFTPFVPDKPCTPITPSVHSLAIVLQCDICSMPDGSRVCDVGPSARPRQRYLGNLTTTSSCGFLTDSREASGCPSPVTPRDLLAAPDYQRLC